MLVTSVSLEEGVCEVIETISIPSGVNEIYLPNNSCLNLEAITVVESNTLYKTIDGVIYDKSGKTLLFYPYAKNVPLFTVPNGVEIIGGRVGSSEYGTISAVSCKYLKTVIISSSVRLIEPCAFAGCVNLENIVLSLDNIDIKYSAFMGCDNLNGTIRTQLGERYGNDLFYGPW
jgi:hypothetical protein